MKIDITQIENETEQALADYIEDIIQISNNNTIDQSFINTQYEKSQDFDIKQNVLFFGKQEVDSNIDGTLIDFLKDFSEYEDINITIITDDITKWSLVKGNLNFRYIHGSFLGQQELDIFDFLPQYQKNIIIIDRLLNEMFFENCNLFEQFKSLSGNDVYIWVIQNEELSDDGLLQLLCPIFQTRVVFQSSVEFSKSLLGNSLCKTETMPETSFYIHQEGISV